MQSKTTLSVTGIATDTPLLSDVDSESVSVDYAAEIGDPEHPGKHDVISPLGTG